MSYTELSSTYPKGRKDYRCEWCDTIIPKGEKHYYRTYIYDGFTTGRMHLECEEAVRKSDQDLISEGWMAGENERGKEMR